MLLYGIEKGKICCYEGSARCPSANESNDFMGDKQQPLSELYRKEVQAAIHSLGSQALRTIAVAFKPLKVTDSIEHERDVEKDFMLVGIQGMIDPPRPEVKQAVKECREAGIRTVMITGDHKVTAMAIAEQLSIYHKVDALLKV